MTVYTGKGRTAGVKIIFLPISLIYIHVVTRGGDQAEQTESEKKGGWGRRGREGEGIQYSKQCSKTRAKRRNGIEGIQ